MVTTAAGGAATAGLEETLCVKAELTPWIISDGYRAPGLLHLRIWFVTSSLCLALSVRYYRLG